MRSNYLKTTLLLVLFIAGLMFGRMSVDLSQPKGGGRDGQRTDRLSGLGATGPRSKGETKVNAARSRGQLYPDDPIERMLWVMGLEENARDKEWDLFVKSLDVPEFQTVIDEFRRRRYSTHDWLLCDVLWIEWAKKDPVVFLQKSLEFEYYDNAADIPNDVYLYEMDAGFARMNQSTAIRALAEIDAEAAVKWALQNDVDYLLKDAIEVMAFGNLERAFEFVSNFPESVHRENSLSKVSDGYVQRGAEAACNWAFSIQDEKLREMAIADIASQLAKNDAKGTADWLNANPSASAAGALHTVMVGMATQDFQEAIAYYEGIQDKEMKASALNGLIVGISPAQNPQTIINLMDSNPSLIADDSILKFVGGVYQKDPGLAVGNIGRIREPEMRQQAYRKHLLNWMKDDQEGAFNWVKAHGMPEDMRLGILELME